MKRKNQRTRNLAAQRGDFYPREYLDSLNHPMITVQIDKVKRREPRHRRDVNQVFQPEARLGIESQALNEYSQDSEGIECTIGSYYLLTEEAFPGPVVCTILLDIHTPPVFWKLPDCCDLAVIESEIALLRGSLNSIGLSQISDTKFNRNVRVGINT
jgi:hypothetical protein